jgi:serine/threonine protein kinase
LSFLALGFTERGRQHNWDDIAHLDLKPCNIFLSSSGGKYGYPRVVLADFGCAIKRSDVHRGREHPFIQECGTSNWYPPENIGETIIPYYGPTTDVWQLGATIHTFCLLVREPERTILASGAPCGFGYSKELNHAVIHLTLPDAYSRPGQLDIVATAEQEFRRAVMYGQMG